MGRFYPSNIKAFASARETSNAIAMAIFQIAAEGDESRMWAYPTDTEAEQVVSRAWELAYEEEYELSWGVIKICRA